MVNENSSVSWRVLDHSYDSVFQNLSLEEAIARRTTSSNYTPTIRLWVNPKSAVLGRFQDPASEVDTGFCEQNDITVVRRFTGGGAVYHDEGTLNFTIVTRKDQRFTLTKLHETSSSIVMNALLSLGMKGISVSQNSILMGNRKVAGAAAALGRGFVLWHSSIIVSTNTDELERVLAPSKTISATRFVRSRWQPVTTLQEAGGKDATIDDVKTALITSAQKILLMPLEAECLRSDEIRLSENLYECKYSKAEWNCYGHWKENGGVE